MQPGQWRETQSGSAFAGALLCRLSLEWNDHTALLASRSASRKDRFATMDIIETASMRFGQFFEIYKRPDYQRHDSSNRIGGDYGRQSTAE